MKPDYKSFYLLAALILLTRIVDAITTYIGSPDLRYEMNPVVALLHQGWAGLFLITAVITGGLIYLAYLHYVRPLRFSLPPTVGKQSLMVFATLAAFGPAGRPTDFLYRMPDTQLLARWAGFVGSYTLLFYGFFVIANNVILIYPSFLTDPWIAAGLVSGYSDIVIITLNIIVLTLNFFKSQYQRSLENQD